MTTITRDPNLTCSKTGDSTPLARRHVETHRSSKHQALQCSIKSLTLSPLIDRLLFVDTEQSSCFFDTTAEYPVFTLCHEIEHQRRRSCSATPFQPTPAYSRIDMPTNPFSVPQELPNERGVFGVTRLVQAWENLLKGSKNPKNARSRNLCPPKQTSLWSTGIHFKSIHQRTRNQGKRLWPNTIQANQFAECDDCCCQECALGPSSPPLRPKAG
jgi:hypothetical protein